MQVGSSVRIRVRSRVASRIRVSFRVRYVLSLNPGSQYVPPLEIKLPARLGQLIVHCRVGLGSRVGE